MGAEDRLPHAGADRANTGKKHGLWRSNAGGIWYKLKESYKALENSNTCLAEL